MKKNNAKWPLKIFACFVLLCGKNIQAQSKVSFEEAHKRLLEDYILFIDSVEKKQTIQSEFDVRAHKHLSRIVFTDGKYEYQIKKNVHVYKSGTRYEKIEWSIRDFRRLWFHKKIYQIKQIGNNYRFIEKVDFDFSNHLKPVRITASYDDNYLLIRILRSKGKKESAHLLVKPVSSIPLLHQD